jgi:WD40 repeat protein
MPIASSRSHLVRHWQVTLAAGLAILLGLVWRCTLTRLQVTRTESDNKRATLSHGCAAFSDAAGTVAVATKDGRLYVFESNCQRGRLLRDYELTTSLALSSNGRMLATGSAEKGVRVCHVDTGQETATWPDVAWVSSIAFAPDSCTVAVGSWENGVTICDAETGAEKAKLRNPNMVTSVAFSPDGRLIVAGSAEVDGSPNLIVWDSAGYRQITSIINTPPVRCVTFSADGTLLATGHWDETVRLWNVRSWREYLVLSDERDVGAFRLAPNGSLAQSSRSHGRPAGSSVGVKNEKPFILWDIDESTPEILNRGVLSGFDSISFSPDGQFLAAHNTRSSRAEVWDITAGLLVSALTIRGSGLGYSLALGTFVVASDEPTSSSTCASVDVIRLTP